MGSTDRPSPASLAFLVAGLWLALPDPAAAQAPRGIAPAAAPARLEGLTEAQAAQLIGTLREAQRGLRAGEKLYFDLLSGAPASYDMTKVSPREAFLGLDLGQLFSIARLDRNRVALDTYRVTVQPERGGLLWDVEIRLGSSGNLERVEMFYRPPAPF